MARMLNPCRFSSSISCTSLPRNSSPHLLRSRVGAGLDLKLRVATFSTGTMGIFAPALRGTADWQQGWSLRRRTERWLGKTRRISCHDHTSQQSESAKNTVNFIRGHCGPSGPVGCRAMPTNVTRRFSGWVEEERNIERKDCNPCQVSTSAIKKSMPASTAIGERMNSAQLVCWLRLGADASPKRRRMLPTV